jgi:flavin-dependent dehydrogenase
MFDVVVVGGGPAGLAVAGALQKRGRSVAVLERTSYERTRAGETLDPETFPLLKALGAWDALGPFLDAQVPHRGVRSAWGSSETEEKASIFHALGEGRHVQRALFDAAMCAWAESTGATVRRDAGTCIVKRHGDTFRAEPARGEHVDARHFVDASGRGAPASARLADRHWLAVDREIAVVARKRGARDLGYELLLEAAELGWWYSVPQADGALVVALVTDSDLIATGDRPTLSARFAKALAKTVHTAARCEDTSEESIAIVRADSGFLMHAEHDWLPVGDAAMATDPLAGNGVARALRSARDVVDRIDAKLRGDATPSTAPMLQKIAQYLDRRASYYEIETRWPDAPFWARRRPGAWREAPITLAPTAILERGEKLARAALAPVEALVPPRALASMLASMDAPTPAHVLLSKLKEAAPLGDRRLLVGLQRLVETGALRVSDPAQGITGLRSTS